MNKQKSKNISNTLAAAVLHKMSMGYFKSVNQESKSEDQKLIECYVSRIRYIDKILPGLNLQVDKETAKQFTRWRYGKEPLPREIKTLMEDQVAIHILKKGI